MHIINNFYYNYYLQYNNITLKVIIIIIFIFLYMLFDSPYFKFIASYQKELTQYIFLYKFFMNIIVIRNFYYYFYFTKLLTFYVHYVTIYRHLILGGFFYEYRPVAPVLSSRWPRKISS